jgi:multidrug resistance efflux pump
LELFYTRYNGRMASWIIPALKAVLPHVKTIYDTAAPVFTKKKADAVPDPMTLLQQQIAELQSAAAQNTAHVKELAAQLQSTVAALQEAAQLAEHRLRRVTIIAAVAGALSLVALLGAVAAVLR